MLPKYELIRSRRRSITLIINPDGTLTVRAPMQASQEYIDQLVARKAGWINDHIARLKTHPPVEKKKFIEGESFVFMGDPYKLKLVDAKKISLEDDLCLPRTMAGKAEQHLIRWYRKQAKKIISERVSWFAGQMGMKYKSVKITGARTRWGSCGPNNTLNFSWRLITAPLPVVDYVVIHELAHTEVKNHSRKFWDKVAETLPNHKQFRKWLRHNNHILVF